MNKTSQDDLRNVCVLKDSDPAVDSDILLTRHPPPAADSYQIDDLWPWLQSAAKLCMILGLIGLAVVLLGLIDPCPFFAPCDDNSSNTLVVPEHRSHTTGA